MDYKKLKDLVDMNYSTRQIAEALNFSQTNVRHWLKKYGLSTSPIKAATTPPKECSWYACSNMSHTKFCSNKCKYKYYAQTKRWKTKLKAIEYKGGKCERCGYNKCHDALEFHHLNPDEKDFGIGCGNTYSWERTKSELDKCIMLCANCHREEHFRLKPKWNQAELRGIKINA